MALTASAIVDHQGQPFYLNSGEAAAIVQQYPPNAYKGASRIRRQGALWQGTAGSANADLIPELQTLRVRSRQALRDNPLAISAAVTLNTHVVGTGLLCRPVLNPLRLGITPEKAKDLQSRIRDEWIPWAESVECDVSRIQNFYGLQALAFDATHQSGDCLVSMPYFSRAGGIYETHVQVTEADRISNPQLRMNSHELIEGVELDPRGAPRAYHVQKVHPGDIYWQNSKNLWAWDRILAFGEKTGRRISWLLYDRKRPGLTRGEPYLSGVLEPLKQLERYTDAELVAAVVNGLFTVFIESPDGTGLQPIASMPLQEGVEGSTQNDLVLAPGAILGLLPGEKVAPANPTRPNANFNDFIKGVCQQLAPALGMPYEVLIKKFEASYSASRASLLSANHFFTIKRNWFALNFCQPIYESWLWELVSKAILPMPGFLQDLRLRQAYCSCMWSGPSAGQIDPLKEVQAAKAKIDLGVSTLEREAQELTGEDWEDVLAQQMIEFKARTELREAQMAATAAMTLASRPPPPTPPVGQGKGK